MTKQLNQRKFRPNLENLEDRLLLTVFGADDRRWVSDTTVTPWSRVGHMISTFSDGSQYQCSGAMVSARHFLTAGHCVYNHSEGGWAVSHEVYLGQNGDYFPYGTANATYQRTFTTWTRDRSSNGDMALVTLDRTVGNSTGWFGMQVQTDSYFSGRPTVNSAGYPGDLYGGDYMYRISGPVSYATTERFYYNGTMDTYGGQSGSPVWRYVSSTGSRYIIGVHTTGGTQYNGATRMTQAKFNTVVGWINADGGRSASMLESSGGLQSEAVHVAERAARPSVDGGKLEAAVNSGVAITLAPDLAPAELISSLSTNQIGAGDTLAALNMEPAPEENPALTVLQLAKNEVNAEEIQATDLLFAQPQSSSVDLLIEDLALSA